MENGIDFKLIFAETIQLACPLKRITSERMGNGDDQRADGSLLVNGVRQCELYPPLESVAII